MKRGTNIQEVARAAGVSITTVSHVLNGKGRLSDETRERVRRVAADLQYSPHMSARNLAGGKTGVLAVAVSQAPGMSFSLTDFAFFIQLMSGATQSALEHGYAPVLVPADPDDGDPFERLNVDGALIIDPVTRDPVVRQLRQRGVPVVTTGRVLGDEDGYWVDNNNAGGARSILRHLERNGASRIALVTGPPITSYTHDNLVVYNAWCAERSIEPLVVIPKGDLTEGAGFDAADALLGADNPPDAIYATLDRLGTGVIRAAQARGVSIPDELMIASYTDSDVARWANPSLTALELHPDEIGRQAMDMLTTIVNGQAPAEQHVHVASRLIARGSTRRQGDSATSA
ncbi:MAG: LacI family DNA-binding transcriptional regulator [Mycobacterium sp.]